MSDLEITVSQKEKKILFGGGALILFQCNSSLSIYTKGFPLGLVVKCIIYMTSNRNNSTLAFY